MSRAFFLAAVAAVIVAVACAWPAEVFLAGLRRGLAWRVALAPDATHLAWRAVVGAIAALGLAVVEWHRAAAAKPSAAAPALWLAVLLLPFAPFLADVFPGLALFDGPLQPVVLLAVVLACAWGLATPRARALAAGALDRAASKPVALASVSFVLYAGVGLWTVGVQGVGGDEPHYLIVVESLLRDGDLRVENNYREGHGAAFGVPEMPPHFRRRGTGGVMYSIHAPGLPALLLPAYTVGGRAGANVFMALVAALTALGVFLLARALAGPRAALVTWAGIALTTPFFLHGWLIFPEMIAACITAWALWWLWNAPGDAGRDRAAAAATWMLRGVVLATLPWFHAKYAVLLAGFGVLLAARLRRRPLQLVPFAVPIALSTLAWFGFFYALYGVADPTIPYGGAAGLRGELSWAHVPRSVLGLLFDQGFGILPHAPIYVVAVAGVLPLLRRKDLRWLSAAVVLTGGAFLVSSARYYMWWGGWSVPGRFAVPLLPLVAPMLALGIGALATSRAGRAGGAALLGASAGATAIMVARPAALMMFNDPDSSGRFLEWLQGSGHLTEVFPTFTRMDWIGQLPRALVVVVAFAIGVIGLRVASRRDRDRAGGEGPLAVTFVVAVLIGFAVVPRLGLGRATLEAGVRRSQLRLLDEWRPQAFFDVSRWRGLRESDLLGKLRIPLARDIPPVDRSGRRTGLRLGPFTLPPGEYEVHVSLRRGALSGDLRVWLQRSDVLLAAAPAAAGVTVLSFALPGSFVLPPVWITASEPGVENAVSRIDLVPRRVVPRDRRPTIRPVSFGAVAEWRRGIRAHLDHNAFSEGDEFWTRGGTTTDVLVAPAGAAVLRGRLRAGAAAGNARVETPGRVWNLDLAADQALEFEFPTPRDGSAVPLHIAFSGGFRPSEIDPANRDHRWLGARVRIAGHGQGR